MSKDYSAVGVLTSILDMIDQLIPTGESSKEIKVSISKHLGYEPHYVSQVFKLMFDMPFDTYVKRRRVNLAANYILSSQNDDLAFVASQFGFSDQSRMNNQFKEEYQNTPGEIRQGNIIVSDIRKKEINISNEKPEESNMTRENYNLENECYATYIDAMMSQSIDSVLDLDTISSLIEIANKLEVPPEALVEECNHFIIEYTSQPEYISTKEYAAITMGITSDEEFEKICAHFNCEWYHVNPIKVDNYRAMIK
ncbi:MAG: AraC family transcriptional regulator [Ruminococcus sp.]|nr:AraC family transcriptional regulator [Ruminococcus sp.]